MMKWCMPGHLRGGAAWQQSFHNACTHMLTTLACSRPDSPTGIMVTCATRFSILVMTSSSPRLKNMPVLRAWEGSQHTPHSALQVLDLRPIVQERPHHQQATHLVRILESTLFPVSLSTTLLFSIRGFACRGERSSTVFCLQRYSQRRDHDWVAHLPPSAT